jgi:hypothetical protein
MCVIFILFGVLLSIGMLNEISHLFGTHIPEIPLMLAIAAIVALFNGKKILKTLDYLFVKYDAAPSALGDAPAAPTFHHENRAERERALKDKLDADTEIALATIRLERARAALADAERDVEAERRRQ